MLPTGACVMVMVRSTPTSHAVVQADTSYAQSLAWVVVVVEVPVVVDVVVMEVVVAVEVEVVVVVGGHSSSSGAQSGSSSNVGQALPLGAGCRKTLMVRSTPTSQAAEQELMSYPQSNVLVVVV